MATVVETREATLTTVDSITDFTVTIPDNGDADTLTAVFANIIKDDGGDVLKKTAQKAYEFSRAEIEPELESIGLPPYAELRTKLATLIHKLRANRLAQ